MNDPVRFQPTPERELLIARLRSVGIGEAVTYAELSELCGANVQTKARSKLHSARRVLRKEGIEFETVPNEGLVRLSEQDKERTLRQKSRRIKRQAADQITIIDHVDFRAVPKDTAEQFVLRRTIAYIVTQSERESTVKKLGSVNAAIEAARKAVDHESGVNAVLRALGVIRPDNDSPPPATES